MKLHQKGYLLVLLSRAESLWDVELVERALREYGLTGRYWENSVCVALDELAAAGLIAHVESKLDGGTQIAPGRLLFRWRLTDFGRRRMRDAGLLEIAPGETA